MEPRFRIGPTFVSVNRRNNEARANLDIRIFFPVYLATIHCLLAVAQYIRLVLEKVQSSVMFCVNYTMKFVTH